MPDKHRLKNTFIMQNFCFLYRSFVSTIKFLRKHQTKINTTINTNKSKLLKNWSFTQRYGLLKRINWKLYIKLSLFRSSPPEVFPKKDQEIKNAEAQSQQEPLCNFIKITPSHRHIFINSRHICRTLSSGGMLLGVCFCMSK